MDKNNPVLVQIENAIKQIDRSLADRLLRKMKSGEINSPDLVQFRIKLQIVDFPNLEEGEAVEIIKRHIFDFFKMDIPLENSLENRYLIQDGQNKELQRKTLKRAILENNEKMGDISVGVLINKFDEKYPVETRNDEDILKFILEISVKNNLTEMEKIILKKILYVYNNLLADGIFAVFDLIAPQKSVNEAIVSQNRKYFERDINKRGSFLENKKIAMSIGDILEKYPEIGEQIISSISLRGRGFSDVLRPTIKNWINDYYQETGAGKHSLMERADYLYHKVNTKYLTDKERQVIMAIIKSLEDGELLNVNIDTKEIIFKIEKISEFTRKDSVKNNFQKQTLENVKSQDDRRELSIGKEHIFRKENKKDGMEEINKRIQNETILSGGYAIKKEDTFNTEKKNNLPAIKLRESMDKKNENSAGYKKEDIVTGQNKEDEEENPYIIKPLSLMDKQKKKADFNTANVIDLRK
jgi:hypothetical protein